MALIACAIAGGYLLLALARPVRACPKCKGQRVITRGKRAARCPRCRGYGRVVRPAAGAVHRFYQSAAAERRRARRDSGRNHHD